ncbi:MAG: hypothetical protein L7F78_23515, partial [Syntrophales bacterium LBB04]|nr:hypothetical protein [Syntrophales bacterium LBB04]
GALSQTALATEPGRDHLLHVNTPDVLPQSFLFHFHRHGSQGLVLVLGHAEPGEIETLRRNLQQISAELSNLNREINKRNAELAWLNEQKNRFLGIAAHDLRSPIGHILTCSGFLLEEAGDRLNEQDREFLNIIRDSSGFMLGLIDDILDLSAIEAGRLNLNLAPLDLLDLFQRNVQLNRFLAEKQGIRWCCSVARRCLS